MRVLQWNIMTPVLPPFRHYGQWERLARVPQFVADVAPDVVVFNELIPKPAVAYLREKMRELGFEHSTEPLWDHLTEYGGVQIFAKQEIVGQTFVLFGEHCVSSDCLSAKGCVLAQLANGVFVAGTHLQSGARNDDVRAPQLERMRALLDTVPSDRTLIVCGDFNTGDEQMLRAALSVHALRNDSPLAFSVDPSANPFVGMDDPAEYTNDEWPDGCYDDLLETHNCKCCPARVYDWVFTRNATGSYRIVEPLAPEPFECSYTWRNTISTRYLSDHNAVVADIATALLPNAATAQVSPQGNTEQSVLFSVLIVMLVVIVLLALACLADLVRARRRARAKLPQP